jgi:hypothetical protein
MKGLRDQVPYLCTGVRRTMGRDDHHVSQWAAVDSRGQGRMNVEDGRSRLAAAPAAPHPAPPGVDTADEAETRDVCIYYGGQRYQTSTKHAGIFLKHALAVADRQGTELVVLVHRDGVDLLLITAAMPLAVGGADGHLLGQEVAAQTR